MCIASGGSDVEQDAWGIPHVQELLLWSIYFIEDSTSDCFKLVYKKCYLRTLFQVQIMDTPKNMTYEFGKTKGMAVL